MGASASVLVLFFLAGSHGDRLLVEQMSKELAFVLLLIVMQGAPMTAFYVWAWLEDLKTER